MSNEPRKPYVYVACESQRLAGEFAEHNGCRRSTWRWVHTMGITHFEPDTQKPGEIWVIGEISRETAQIIDYLTKNTRIRVRFSDIDEKIKLKREYLRVNSVQNP